MSEAIPKGKKIVDSNTVSCDSIFDLNVIENNAW